MSKHFKNRIIRKIELQTLMSTNYLYKTLIPILSDPLFFLDERDALTSEKCWLCYVILQLQCDVQCAELPTIYLGTDFAQILVCAESVLETYL